MRSAHWNNAIPHIQQWVIDRFEAAGKSVWDYVEYRVTFAQVGINPDNFCRELAPKIQGTRREHWSPDAWWNAVAGRIYYFFHRAADKADRSTGRPRPALLGRVARSDSAATGGKRNLFYKSLRVGTGRAWRTVIIPKCVDHHASVRDFEIL